MTAKACKTSEIKIGEQCYPKRKFKSVLKAMQSIVDYSYSDECSHCEAEYGIEFQDDGSILDVDSRESVKIKDIGDHIFFSIRKVDKFLDGVKL